MVLLYIKSRLCCQHRCCQSYVCHLLLFWQRLEVSEHDRTKLLNCLSSTIRLLPKCQEWQLPEWKNPEMANTLFSCSKQSCLGLYYSFCEALVVCVEKQWWCLKYEGGEKCFELESQIPFEKEKRGKLISPLLFFSFSTNKKTQHQ